VLNQHLPKLVKLQCLQSVAMPKSNPQTYSLHIWSETKIHLERYLSADDTEACMWKNLVGNLPTSGQRGT
jgi:hypothetical protein